MYKDEIKELLIEKKEYDWYLISECIRIYKDLFLTVHDSQDARKQLLVFLKECLEHSANERAVLKHLNRQFGSLDEIPHCEDALNEMDDLFEDEYKYDDIVMSFYESLLWHGHTASFALPSRFKPSFDENHKNNLIKRIGTYAEYQKNK